MSEPKWFKDGIGGIQLYAGDYKDSKAFNSDDGGRTWWSGWMFRDVPRAELEKLARTILEDLGAPALKTRVGVTPERIREVVDIYESGGTVADCAKHLGVCRTTARKILVREGVTIRTRGPAGRMIPVTDMPGWDEELQAYIDGDHAKECAERLGVNYQSFLDALQWAGVKREKAPRSGMIMDEEAKADVVARRASGESYDSIAADYRVSVGYVVKLYNRERS